MNEPSQNKLDVESSIPGLTRRQFIDQTVKKALVAGSIIGGVGLVDTFLAPPAYAGTSTSGATGGGTDTSGPSGPDTNPGTDMG